MLHMGMPILALTCFRNMDDDSIEETLARRSVSIAYWKILSLTETAMVGTTDLLNTL